MKTHDLFVGFVSMDGVHIALDFIKIFSYIYIMYFDFRKEIDDVRAQSQSSGILKDQL